MALLGSAAGKLAGRALAPCCPSPSGRPAAHPLRLDIQAKQRFTGRVVAIAMAKTAVVEINSFPKDRIYRKRVRSTRKLFAHDEEQTSAVGDLVAIESCRPLSKRKAFYIKETLKKSTF